MIDRINQLENFLKDEPDDPFNRYALALEYLKFDAGKSQDLFETLISKYSDYLPTYYPFANLLIETNQADRAERIYQQGMETALRLNNLKTYRELQSAYNDWLFERS